MIMTEPTPERYDQHVMEWDRYCIRNSDEFSPTIKKVLERFWARWDEIYKERVDDNAG